MFRRPVDFYKSIENTEEVDDLLNKAGFGDALKSGLANSLDKENNIVIFAK